MPKKETFIYFTKITDATFELFIFLFFVLVDEVTKNENRLHNFLYGVFRLQCKTGKMKMKNNKKTKQTIYVIFLFFVTFVNQNQKRKMG